MGGLSAQVPAHDAVRSAVQRDGDPDLAAWTSAADDYVLVPVEFAGAEHHLFFELTALAVSHPTGVLVAYDLRDGDVEITSGHPETVWRVLRSEPSLVEPNTIVQLLGSFDRVEYEGPGSEPALTEIDGGWRCDLRVREVPDGENQRWRLLLTNRPEWRVE